MQFKMNAVDLPCACTTLRKATRAVSRSELSDFDALVEAVLALGAELME